MGGGGGGCVILNIKELWYSATVMYKGQFQFMCIYDLCYVEGYHTIKIIFLPYLYQRMI